MSCYGLEASPYVVSLPDGTVNSNGGSTLDCCECPCEGESPIGIHNYGTCCACTT